MATKTDKTVNAADTVQRFIYLGPNHPKALLVNSTIYKGGVITAANEILEKCPSAKALLVSTDQTAIVMKELRDSNSVYAALYKQAEIELKKEG